MRIPAIFLLMSLPMMSCSSVTKALDNVSDADLASFIETGANKGAAFAIKYAMSKYPEKATQILKDAAVADQVVREVMIPLFTKASLGTLTKGAMDVAISQLSAKLTNSPIESIVSVISGVVEGLPLPPNPTDKLSPRLQGAIAGGFTGLAEGIESQTNTPPPPVTPPAPPPPAPPK